MQAVAENKWSVTIGEPTGGGAWDKQEYIVVAAEQSDAVQLAKAHAREDGVKNPKSLRCIAVA